MVFSKYLLPLLLSTPSTLSQLSPSPTYSPPPASSGAITSSSNSIPNSQWSNLLANLIYFYDCQRSGNLGSNNRVPWRNNSGLNDGKDAGVDLSGGFFDAGDYIKVTYPFSWTIGVIAWSGIDFGQGFTLSKQSAYLDSNLRWGFDWLMNAHPSPNTLFVQVGLNDVDNNYWGGDQGIPTPRPSLQINGSAPGTDCAASTAAAFAIGSILYGGGKSFLNQTWTSNDLQNSTYSGMLLQHAKDLYQFATSATPFTVYSQTVPATAEDYGSNGFGDDLVWGGLWLYLATNDISYYNSATNYYNQFSQKGLNTALDWDSRVLANYFLLFLIAKNNGQGDLNTYQSEVERYFDRILNDSPNGKKAGDGVTTFFTPGGLLYYDGDSNDASLNPAMNVVQIMIRYYPFATSSQKSQQYYNFAHQQINYALGQNPMNIPYVVGQHPNSPVNPHSAPASGGSDIGNIDHSPEVEAYVIYGATVGGPDRKDRFFDIRSDWPETEIALDYNAPMIAIASYGVINNSSDPFYVSLPPGSKVTPPGKPTDDAFPGGGSGGGGLSTGAIVAIVVVLILVALVLVLAFWKRDRIRVSYRKLRLNRY